MTASSIHAQDGTVTDRGALFLAMEMHAAAEKKRRRFRRVIRRLGRKFKTRFRKRETVFSSGFAPQPLVEKVASAALFDSSTPIVIRHRQIGALSQFFSCRLLPYMERSAVCGGLAEVSRQDGSSPAEALARAIQSLAPEMNLSILERLPVLQWAQLLERRFQEAGPQRVLVVQHFDELCLPHEKPIFRQFLRRLARISGFSVVVGVRGRTDSGERAATRAPAGWARPGKRAGVLDLNRQIWTPPAGPNTGRFFDWACRLLGPWLDELNRLRIFHPFQDPAVQAGSAAARAHAH